MTQRTILKLDESETEIIKQALRTIVALNETTLDHQRRLSLRQASEPGNAAVAEQAARRIVAARAVLDRIP